MIRRLLSGLALLWLFGFAWFSLFLPQAAMNERTDAVVVFTGGEGRIARAIDLLEQELAEKILVSGVDSDVTAGEFRAEYEVPAGLMACCIELDYRSTDTRSNAAETRQWLAAEKVRSVRLVTSDWHMRRAALELEKVVPARVRILRDAVHTQPSLKILLIEYNKFLARRIALLQGS